MAFISNKERKSLIKKTHSNYAFRKLVLFIDVLGLIGFIMAIFICGHYGIKLFEGEDLKISELTPVGMGMLAYAVVLAVLSIISFVLIFSIRSPKTVTQENRLLESSPLAGKKIHIMKQTPGQIVKARTEIKKKKKGK